ncbi:MAG TPA: hypothetical protein VEC37_18205 [Bacillota bacterium]|nr:hypothetical protein [Bacillota bacterium]
MANTFESVHLSITSLKNFQDPELAANVLEKINEYGKDFIPTKYGVYQPLKKPYNPEDISGVVQMWINEENNMVSAQNLYAAGQVLMEKTKGHKVSYHMEWEKSNEAKTSYFNFFIFSMDIAYLKKKKGLERFICLCNELIILLEPVQGEIVNLSFPGWEAPINLRVRHPELHWMALFGKPYIDMFGKEKLLNTPCHSINSIGDNVIAIQVIESIFEPIPSDARTTIKKYLGEDAFVEEGKSCRSYTTGRVPEFDFSEVLFDKTKPISEPKIRTRSSVGNIQDEGTGSLS